MSLRRIVEELRLLVYNHGEKYLDVAALLAHRQKLREAGAGTAGATTTANVGAFMVPLGGRVVRDASGAGDIQGGKLLRPPAYTPPLQASGKLRRRKRRRS